MAKPREIKMLRGVRTTHRVTLRIEQGDTELPMTEKQAAAWVAKHFAGNTYGEVRVTDVINEEVTRRQ